MSKQPENKIKDYTLTGIELDMISKNSLIKGGGNDLVVDTSLVNYGISGGMVWQDVIDDGYRPEDNADKTEKHQQVKAIVDISGAGDFSDLQQAIDYVNSLDGGTILINPGTYILKNNITIYSNITLEGRSPQDTILSFNTTAKSILVKGASNYTTGAISINAGASIVVGVGTVWTTLTTNHYILLGNSNWFKITAITDDTHLTIETPYFGENLSGVNYVASIIANNVEINKLTITGSTTHAIDAQYTNNFKMFNVFLLANGGDGLYLDTTNWNILDYVVGAYNTGRGFYANKMLNSSCNRFFLFTNLGSGGTIEGDSEDNAFHFMKSYNNLIGLTINSSSNNVFTTFDARYNNNQGLYINGGDYLTINMIADGNLDDGIRVTGDSNNIIIDESLIQNNGSWGLNVVQNTVDNLLMTGCSLENNTAGPIIDGGTGTILRNNQGVPETMDKEYKRMKNTSGAAVDAGDIVILKAVAAGDEVTTTTTQGDDKVYGMAIETIANNSYGRIQTLGLTNALKVDGTTDIAIGDFIGAFTTAKIGMKAAAGDMAIAYALEAYIANDSLGVIDCIIIKPRKI